jgi:hypothetical protein
MIAGGAATAVGTLAAGNAAKKSAYFKAAQEDMAANEARASSQRAAMEERRKGDLATSRIQALGAASGTDASSGDILKLSSDVEGRTEYQALADMYTGENRAEGLQDAAMGDRFSGDAAQTGSRYQAVGTLLSSGGSAYARFNGVPERDRTRGW